MPPVEVLTREEILQRMRRHPEWETVLAMHDGNMAVRAAEVDAFEAEHGEDMTVLRLKLAEMARTADALLIDWYLEHVIGAEERQ